MFSYSLWFEWLVLNNRYWFIRQKYLFYLREARLIFFLSDFLYILISKLFCWCISSGVFMWKGQWGLFVLYVSYLSPNVSLYQYQRCILRVRTPALKSIHFFCYCIGRWIITLGHTWNNLLSLQHFLIGFTPIL